MVDFAAVATDYDAWVRERRPSIAEGRILDGTVPREALPSIAVVVPVQGPQERLHIERCIASIGAQLYRPREIFLVTCGGSTETRAAAAMAATLEPQARVMDSSFAGLASTLTGTIESAESQWVAVVPPTGMLQPRALLALATGAVSSAGVGVVYTDEDTVTETGRRSDPVLKPDWSPRLHLEGNYLGSLVMMRRTAVISAGGFDEGDAESGCYDLLLRLAEGGTFFSHVAEPVYSRFEGVPWLPMDSVRQKALSRQAVAAALDRRGLAATVTTSDGRPWLRTRAHEPFHPSLTVIIPTRDRLDLLEECISSLELVTDYPEYRVVIVDNDSRDAATLDYLERSPHQVVQAPGPFNFSHLVNGPGLAADTDYLLLLNNDTVTVQSDWLQNMVEEALLPRVAAVGCRIERGDGAVDHEGVGLGLEGSTARNLKLGGYGGLGGAVRDVSAVTAACMLIRTDVFQQLRGFDPLLAAGYGDVDFCLRARRTGYSIVYTPHAVISHAVGASRAGLSDASDDLAFRELWADVSGRIRDPFVNPLIDEFSPLRLRIREPARAQQGELELEVNALRARVVAAESNADDQRWRWQELDTRLRELMAELEDVHAERRHVQMELAIKNAYVAQLRAELDQALPRADLVRYRLADKLNSLLLRVAPLHRTLKAVARTRV